MITFLRRQSLRSYESVIERDAKYLHVWSGTASIKSTSFSLCNFKTIAKPLFSYFQVQEGYLLIPLLSPAVTRKALLRKQDAREKKKYIYKKKNLYQQIKRNCLRLQFTHRKSCARKRAELKEIVAYAQIDWQQQDSPWSIGSYTPQFAGYPQLRIHISLVALWASQF